MIKISKDVWYHMAAGETFIQSKRIPQQPTYLTKHTFMYVYPYFEQCIVIEEYENKDSVYCLCKFKKGELIMTRF